jgi:hypothetical protein
VWINDTTSAKCLKECPEIKRSIEYKTEAEHDKDKCCFMRCLYSTQRILWQDNNDNVVRVDVQMLKGNFRKNQVDRLGVDWTEVVGKSVSTCTDMCEYGSDWFETTKITKKILFHADPPTFSTGHCLPLYFLNTMVCVNRENFLNCPTYDRNLERCKQLRQSVQHCRDNTEVTVRDWDRFFF